MIEIVEFDLEYGKTEDHEELNALLGEGFAIIGHVSYQHSDGTPWERFTLYKPDATQKAESE